MGCAHSSPKIDTQLDRSGENFLLTISVVCPECRAVFQFPDKAGKPKDGLKIACRPGRPGRAGAPEEVIEMPEDDEVPAFAEPLVRRDDVIIWAGLAAMVEFDDPEAAGMVRDMLLDAVRRTQEALLGGGTGLWCDVERLSPQMLESILALDEAKDAALQERAEQLSAPE